MIIIFILIIVCVVVIGLSFLKKYIVSNAKELTYVDYKASRHDKVYKSIVVLLDQNKIRYIYKNGKEKEKDIDYNVFNRINEIFLKYDVFNWNYYDRSEYEILDYDNTLVYYKFSNGEALYADIQTHPRGKELFFDELKEYLCSL